MSDFNRLRAKRLRNRISKVEMARRLGCAESWVNALELGHYHGPARAVWEDKYRQALDALLKERKAKK